MFCILSAHWHKILEFVPSCPIYGWLAWWYDFFSCWANLWRSSACIQPKKVQPLGIYFWRLRLFRSPFLVGEAEHMWLQPFARTNVFSIKNMCLHFGRALTQMLEFVTSFQIYGWLAWWCNFFLWGQPLEIIRMYSAKKGLAPWNLFLTPAPRPLQVTLFGWWSWTYVVGAFC